MIIYLESDVIAAFAFLNKLISGTDSGCSSLTH